MVFLQLLQTAIEKMDGMQLQLLAGHVREVCALRMVLNKKPRLWCSLRITDALSHVIGHKLKYRDAEMCKRDAQGFYKWDVLCASPP